jgi:type IV secretion system T-DNA border endonuclease VirD2
VTAFDVVALLRRGGGAAPEVDPLEAVMGEDFAVLEPERVARTRSLKLLHDRNLERERARLGRGRTPSSLEIVGRKPQAVVKLIGKGGAKDGAGLRRQMAYLSQGGAVELTRSERHLGAPIEADEAEAFAETWSLRTRSGEGADRTTHFLASFPRGTDPAAAERAGRAWAEEMFGSGRFGDVWDYYTAFHTDREHPHMHVVVNRRGLEKGDWLKVSRRSAISYDVLREVQAEVARAEGIELEATPRFARGEHARPIPDAELRRATLEERAPVTPAHTEATAILAAASVLDFARRIEAEARLARERHPAAAAALDAAAAAIKTGRVLEANPEGLGFTAKEIDAMAETIAEQRWSVLANFERMDRELATIERPADRARLERSAAAIKAEAAAYMPDRDELRAFARLEESGRYRGVEAGEGRGPEIKASADAAVAEIARQAGLDPEVVTARYDGGPVAAPVAERWRREELAALTKADGGDEKRLTRDETEGVERRLAAIHHEIGEVYTKAGRAIHEAAEARARARTEVGRAVAEGGPEEGAEARALARRAREVLSVEERERLARGDPRALAGLTEDAEAQGRLARAYQEVERREAATRDRAEDVSREAERGREGDADAEAERRRSRERDDGHSL